MRYKVRTKNGFYAITEHQDTLFGKKWVVIASFYGCKNRVSEIVRLLNECNKIHNDRIGHTET